MVLTWDHLLPRAWYPATTPPELEKWQIPSCMACNQEYGRIESDLLVRFGMCLDPTKAAASGIAEKALRALDPAQAKNSRDARARQKNRERFIAELMPVQQVPQHSVLPGFGLPLSAAQLETGGVRIPKKGLERLAEKICRGIFYIEERCFIEPPYEITSYVLNDAGAAYADGILERYGVSHTRGPGLVIRRAKTTDDQMAAMLSIEVWGQLKMHATVVAEPSDPA